MTKSEAKQHSNKLGAGAKKRKQLKSKKDKFDTVMEEFARGTLHSGSGEIVKNKKQALAIAYSESRKSLKMELVAKTLELVSLLRKYRKG